MRNVGGFHGTVFFISCKFVNLKIECFCVELRESIVSSNIELEKVRGEADRVFFKNLFCIKHHSVLINANLGNA